MAFVIGEPCIDVMDKSCMEECPVECIYEGDRMLYINPSECIDCAACESACPMEAIRPDRELPEGWADFRDASKTLFAEHDTDDAKVVTDPGWISDWKKSS